MMRSALFPDHSPPNDLATNIELRYESWLSNAAIGEKLNEVALEEREASKRQQRVENREEVKTIHPQQLHPANVHPTNDLDIPFHLFMCR